MTAELSVEVYRRSTRRMLRMALVATALLAFYVMHLVAP